MSLMGRRDSLLDSPGFILLFILVGFVVVVAVVCPWFFLVLLVFSPLFWWFFRIYDKLVVKGSVRQDGETDYEYQRRVEENASTYNCCAVLFVLFPLLMALVFLTVVVIVAHL